MVEIFGFGVVSVELFVDIGVGDGNFFVVVVVDVELSEFVLVNES